MAGPSYTTDLQDVTTAETATGWAELSGHTSGGAPAADTEAYLQGSSCVSQATGQAVGTTAGVQFDYGSAIPWTGGYVFMVWQMFSAGSNIDTWANGGMRFGVGSSSGNMNYWNALGKDYGSYPYGGWQNTAIDPASTPDLTEGSPVSGSYRVFGSLPNMLNKITKGSPHVVDAIRYGRGTLNAINGDSTNGYADFPSMAAANDAGNARWGLFQLQSGGYKWKGLMSLGTAATAVDFRDSNKAVIVDDTPRAYLTFNKVEVHNAASIVQWLNISMQAAGATSPGRFEMVDNATVTKDGCTFTDMDTFVYQSAATITGTTFRRCGQVTLGGATMDGCLFSNSTANVALACGASVATLSNTEFIGSGVNHAIEITGGTSHTLNGIKFTGYAASNGSTGNEAVFVNIASGNVTIYADATFSYRTAGATVTVISGSVTLGLDVTTAAGTPIPGAAVFVQAANATGPLPYQEAVTIANSGTTATVTHTGHGMLTNDKVVIRGASLPENNGVFDINVTDANTYTYTMASAPGSSPTGTITSTWVALYGTSDANGRASMSRAFASDQPITGWARKSSSSPYYKTGPISGVISSAAGATVTALLIGDE